MKFQYLRSAAEIEALIQHHNAVSYFVVIDFETTSKNPRKAQLLEIQMSGKSDNSAVMFDGCHLPLLLKLNCLLVLHNYKYDFTVADRHGVNLRGMKVRDTMLMHHLADENAEHGLDPIVRKHWKDPYKERFWGKYETYESAPLAARLDYGCRDIVYTGRLYRLLTSQLQGKEALVDHAHRLAAALLETEIRGINVDLPYTIDMGTQLKKDIVSTEQGLRRLGGYHCEMVELRAWNEEMEKRKTDKGKQRVEKPDFNFASGAQVMELLYDELKLPEQRNPKTDRRTVDDNALAELESKHPLIPELRKLRKYSKMYTAFVEGILGKAEDGRVYPSFNINGTKTGRISHSEPNMGQIPAKGDWAKIRGIFTPEPGHKLITCDYGQLEVCIAAHYSRDENLLKIINEGASQHDITASSLNVPRPLAKTLNFGMQYLCSPFKVRDLLGCSQKDAEATWQKYWQTYQGLKDYIDSCIDKLVKGQPIINLFGRERQFPDFQLPSYADPSRGSYTKEMRQAFNFVIQGTGADITSRAFYLIDEELRARGWGRGWFTVHDEVLAEVETRFVSQARELIQKIMVGVGEEVGLSVPLAVDCSEGLDRWQK